MIIQKKYRQTKAKTIISRVVLFLSLLKVKILKKEPPLVSIIVVTNKCNFNCKYCFGNYHLRKNKDYTNEELKKLIDELYRLGTKYLNVHGGEALLRKDIGEIINYIKSKGIYCCLITNGSLLKNKINEIINVDNLTISLDGRRENNDINRCKGSYDIAINAIKLAKSEGIPLRVSATLTKYSMHDIGFLSKLAKEIGFSLEFSILFKPLTKAKDLEMTNAEIKKALKEVLEYKKKGYPIFTSNRALKYAINWPFNHNAKHYLNNYEESCINKINKNKLIKCYYSKIKFTFEGNGDVYPCFLLGTPDKFKPLNWKEVGVKKALEHVKETNTCITCPALAQNDWNLLLGLDFKIIIFLIKNQIIESFRRR